MEKLIPKMVKLTLSQVGDDEDNIVIGHFPDAAGELIGNYCGSRIDMVPSIVSALCNLCSEMENGAINAKVDYVATDPLEESFILSAKIVR